MLSDKIAAGLAVVAGLFLVGVIYVGATLPQKPDPLSYHLEIVAEAKGDVVETSGKTNLPDDARLEIVVDRLYRLVGRDLWTAARVGSGRVEVHEGTWRLDIPVDDFTWVDELDQRLDINEIDPVEAVYSSLRTTVLFSPMIDQPKAVQQAMGHNFEGLAESEQADQEGDRWVLRRHKDVAAPLRAELESILMAHKAAGH